MACRERPRGRPQGADRSEHLSCCIDMPTVSSQGDGEQGENTHGASIKEGHGLALQPAPRGCEGTMRQLQRSHSRRESACSVCRGQPGHASTQTCIAPYSLERLGEGSEFARECGFSQCMFLTAAFPACMWKQRGSTRGPPQPVKEGPPPLRTTHGRTGVASKASPCSQRPGRSRSRLPCGYTALIPAAGICTCRTRSS